MKNTHMSKTRPKMTKRNKVLCLGIAVFAGLVGIWFSISPSLEKKAVLQEQNRLLDSIAAGDGKITLSPNVIKAQHNFYIEDEESTPLSEPSALPGIVELTQEENAEPVKTNKPDYPLEITGIGILSIDKIDLTLPVVDGISTDHLKLAAGHVPETPPIGEMGNAVIAGHRSYDYGQYFNRLDELEIGDTIRYTGLDGESCSFEVFEKLEIQPEDQLAFVQPADASVITLYTCTPIRIATHRLLVRAAKINR